MSLEQVVRSEKANKIISKQKTNRLFNNSYELIYRDTLLNRVVEVRYTFVNNKLVLGEYKIISKFPLIKGYYKSYFDIQEQISKKYGKGEQENLTDEIGSDVSFVTRWYPPKTTIILSIQPNVNLNGIDVEISYFEKKKAIEFEKEFIKKNQNKL